MMHAKVTEMVKLGKYSYGGHQMYTRRAGSPIYEEFVNKQPNRFNEWKDF